MLSHVKNNSVLTGVCLVALCGSVSLAKKSAADVETSSSAPAIVWRDPVDLESRNLLFGSGGEQHQPNGPLTFVKEDLGGTNPKFDAQTADGVKWKVKLGLEARSETAASRLVWAAGYFTDEDYFVKDLKVSGLPAHLHRGQKLVSADGTIHNVRLKRQDGTDKRLGTWRWKDNFLGRNREVNGLRVIMALINNWDLKDENNAIYQRGNERIYAVSDLGAAFGTSALSAGSGKSKDNLANYSRSKFFRMQRADDLDFETPGLPSPLYIFDTPEYVKRIPVKNVGRHVLRKDALWIGGILGRLSDQQIADAFKGAGYSPDEVKGFSGIVRQRIDMLKGL